MEVERDEASVAAVIKLRAVGQAGSSVPLMSLCSACSVALPCGLLLKRRPRMDEACPLRVLSSMAAESQACQQRNTTAHPH